MRHIKRTAAVFLAVGLILLVFERRAHAYLDPGSGSMMLQVMLGGVAAVGVIGKLYWHRLLELFGKRPSDQNDDR